MQSYVLQICRHEDRSQTKPIYGLRCVFWHSRFLCDLLARVYSVNLSGKMLKKFFWRKITDNFRGGGGINKG